MHIRICVNSLAIEWIELGPVLNNPAWITADTGEAIKDQTGRTRPDIEDTWRGGAPDVLVGVQVERMEVEAQAGWR